MNEKWKWEDLRVFIAVARAGGLSMATQTTGLSAPTLGRRILALERALEMELFHRSQDGYTPTTAGYELLEIAEGVENEAAKVDRWRDRTQPSRKIRIAVGFWTGLFLAHKLSELRPKDGKADLVLITGIGEMDLQRRQANIGLRNRRPERLGLAGQRLVRVEFSIYGDKDYVETHPAAKARRRFWDCDWLTIFHDGPKPPSAAWLDTHLERDAVLTCNSPAALMAALTTGTGLAVLPCFIGDASPRLVRCSEPIAELAHDQWLVSHDEDRHEPHITDVIRSIADLIRRHRRLFEGGAVASPAQG
ncbi:LysR family transcriptional regulator [Hoeflea prorocentri]|uniref:LysR family transcriptional regulator n=1 Tax=Hoeflea prorocentri TaxID=1922333 RepID=A0A9X3UMA2_9HYPH|nr:LysR family transcriptional regulator [Hoeflea prorocentri]MCY6383199.1 LysR family transcriptional regulator [Hoeflea prorocentri]MDA5400999.1 LysR family transcriptional regulator [Hoeflea prorocentri]